MKNRVLAISSSDARARYREDTVGHVAHDGQGVRRRSARLVREDAGARWRRHLAVGRERRAHGVRRNAAGVGAAAETGDARRLATVGIREAGRAGVTAARQERQTILPVVVRAGVDSAGERSRRGKVEEDRRIDLPRSIDLARRILRSVRLPSRPTAPRKQERQPHRGAPVRRHRMTVAGACAHGQ
jgi:hypothetical protein